MSLRSRFGSGLARRRMLFSIVIAGLVASSAMYSAAPALARSKWPRATPSIAACFAVPTCFRPYVIAHKGSIFEAPTDSLLGDQIAYKEGADVIETDLQVTKDNVAMLLHDDDLSRLTCGTGLISQMTAAQVEKVHFRNLTGCSSQTVMPFTKLLAWAKHKVMISLVMKTPRPDVAVQTIETAGMEDQVFLSMHMGDYQQLRAITSTVYGMVRADNTDDVNTILSFNDPRLIMIELAPGLATQDLVHQINAAGKKTHADAFYTVGDYEFLGAACYNLFPLGLEAPSTNRTPGCLQQEFLWKQA